MSLSKSALFAFIFPLLSFSYQQPQSKVKPPVEIRGVVMNAETGKPIKGIYLFVTEGEEEALTDAKGEFRIRTWKPMPLLLTSQNQDYHNVRVKVTQADGVITVKLKKRLEQD